MARTRGEIKALVQDHTGRADKDTLIESLCDSALKYAVQTYHFRDAVTLETTSTLTAGDLSFDLTTLATTPYKILSAVWVNDGDTQGSLLVLKNRQWWDKFVIFPGGNNQGIPVYALKEKNTLFFSQAVNGDWKLQLRYLSIPTYTDDSTETPIEDLDLFIEYRVTSDVFFSLKDKENYFAWNRRAIGNNPEKPGGELGRVIAADKTEPAQEDNMTRPWSLRVRPWGRLCLTSFDVNGDMSNPLQQTRTWC